MNKIILTSFSYASNLMFFTGLMVILTIFGYSSLAAEIGLIYSIIASVNLIFSYNLKNQILLDGNKSLASEVYSFRIFLGILLTLILVFVIRNYDLNFFSNTLIFYSCIIICQHWLIEVILIICEIEKKYNFFKFYNVYKFSNFLILLVNLFFFENIYLNEVFLYIIVINFLIIINNKINQKLFEFKFLRLFNKISKLFAFTSSISVILSVLFWRIFIFYNFTKDVAGILFSSFAIGSFIGTLFSSSIIPSMIKKNIKYKIYLNNYFFFTLFFSIFTILLLNNLRIDKIILNDHNFLFIKCTILSILGSSVILFSIAKRVNYYNLKSYRTKIHTLDIINSIIVAFIPVMLFYINKDLIIYSYFLSALLSLLLFSNLFLNDIIKK